MTSRLMTLLIAGIGLTGVGTWYLASDGWSAITLGCLFVGFTLSLTAALQDGPESGPRRTAG